MPKWTKKELQDRFGVDRSYIYTNKKRGKCEFNEDGEFDDTIPKNAKFLNTLNKYRQNKEQEKEKQENNQNPEPKRQSKAVPLDDDADVPDEPVKEQPDDDAYDTSGGSASGIDGLEARYKLAQSEHKEEQTRKERLLIEKMEGKLIPVADIQGAFSQIIAALRGKFEDGIESYITEIQDRKKLSSKEVAEIRERMVGVVNAAVEDAVDESKKNVERIVDDIIEKKKVG